MFAYQKATDRSLALGMHQEDVQQRNVSSPAKDVEQLQFGYRRTMFLSSSFKLVLLCIA